MWPVTAQQASPALWAALYRAALATRQTGFFLRRPEGDHPGTKAEQAVVAEVAMWLLQLFWTVDVFGLFS